MNRKRETVVGRNAVLESLRAGKRTARRLFVLRGAKGLDPILNAARQIPVEERTRRELDQYASGTVHQGVILEADPLPVLPLGDWLKRATGPDTLAVLLDGVEDPHNFGAIVRTAAAFGAEAVVFPSDRAAPISPASVKAAAGGMEYIHLVQIKNVARSIQVLQESNFWVAALEADAEKTLWQADLTGRLAIVIGSEGRGVRPLVRKRCDFALKIPLAGPIGNLNASVSAAIALAEWARQQNAKT